MTSNPAELRAHDPAWPTRAEDELDRIARAFAALDRVDEIACDHIGSTSVPGLRAKPFVDLQVRILPMPADDVLDALLAPLGYVRSRGSRPDSPGVHRDIPRGDEQVPDVVWEKSLFTHPEVPAILHLRRADSPWGRFTVWFRDWLRAHSDQRRRYEEVKTRLSKENEGKADYDDYTLAKTAFFDDVQDAFTAWARARL